VFVEQGRRKKDISPSTCAGVNDVSCVSYPSIKKFEVVFSGFFHQ
jgi:hypothetical protein